MVLFGGACDVPHWVAFGEVIVPSPLEADVFAFYLDPSPVKWTEIVALCNADDIPVGCAVNRFLDVLHRGFFCPGTSCTAFFNVYVVSFSVWNGNI